MRQWTLIAVLAFLLIPAALSHAQRADLIDEPSPALRALPRQAPAWQNFELEKIGLEVLINGQKASCTLRYVIFNPGPSPIEVDFLAPLPQGGTVTGLNLFDGKNEMAGEVYGQDEAWKIYREIVSKMKDPALLEYAGRDTFRARIFPVPAGGRQSLELKFDFLAPKSDGQVGFSFPLAGPMTSGRTPAEQDVNIIVRNAPGLSGFYSPLEGLEIDHKAGQDAKISFSSRDTAVLDKFQLYYQTESGPLGGLTLSHKPDGDDDGFFLFLAEPALDQKQEPPRAKNVIFALDKSGSMSGPKFRQAREALHFILDRLEDRDSFNLVDYNAKVYTWQAELMDMSRDNRRAAKDYVDNLRSGGSTNIEAALATAFSLLKETDEPSYIIFLTDGQPTVGEKNEMKLAELAAKLNPRQKARLFSFGLGHDVNARLLDRLSGQAGGSSVFVDPDENLEAKLSAFFSRLTSPVLLRPSLKADRALNRVLPENLPDLFSGQQLVAVGRYPKGGNTVFTLAGLQGKDDFKSDHQVKLAEGPSPDGQFIAGLWAQRRIGQLIDEIDLAGGKPSPELVDELVQLSKKYGILTPYTSFLALENQALTRQAELASTTADNLSIMEETAGPSANLQRAVKADMKHSSAAAPSSPKESALRLDKAVAQSGGASLNLPAQWGGRTFYLKNGRWQAENLTEEDLKKAVNVKQFSEEYFKLGEKLKPEQKIWLSQRETVIFKHDGITYLIEPEGPPKS